MNELKFIGFFTDEMLFRYEQILEKIADLNKDVRFEIRRLDNGGYLYMNEACMKAFIRNSL